jgi:16S rRNA A1518/A1519 N6-dimethyltransferase RsmA/KsgA/DIM1 with predicted DNA glycosylase/AP lyase activity
MTPQSLRAQTLLLLSRHRVEIDPSLDEQQLIDPDVIKRFVEYCDIQPDETVLEIGPGTGNITEVLLEKVRYLICIEKNPKYLPILRERFNDSPKLKIIQDDALKTYLPQHDRLASNLPYMIAEAFIQRTLRLGFKTATLLVPTRFAETILAKPSGEHTKLTWLSQLFYVVTQHEIIPSEAYLPEPRVSTSIVSLKPRNDLDAAECILKELMQQGDKYTKNALREALIRTERCASKNDARSYIVGLNLEESVLDSWASRLSLSDLQIIEEKLRAN